jgi:putative membrane protein
MEESIPDDPRHDSEKSPSSKMSLVGRLCLVYVLIATGVSYYGAYDRSLWYMEAAPVLITLPILAFTARRFPLTPLLQLLLAMHATILLMGAHSSYAKAPFGFWIQSIFKTKRNPFDRVGHFVQGYVPAILTREIILRKTPLQPGFRQSFLTTCVCLAVSAMYELIEWGAAKALGQGADEFLATQGDQWDTQWDMFLALIGAIVAQIMFFKLHDRQLANVQPQLTRTKKMK